MRPLNEIEDGGSKHFDDHVGLDLLLGLIPQDRETELIAHMTRCGACEKRFIDLASRSEHLESIRVLERNQSGELILTRRGSALDARVTPLPVSEASTQGPPRSRFSISFGAAALAAAAILLMLFLPQQQPLDDLMLVHLLPSYTAQLELRDAEATPAASGLMEALAAYDRGEAEQAAEMLLVTPPGELDELDRVIRSIYLGSALVMSNRYNEAVTLLESAPLTLLPDEWGGETRWTLCVALLKSGRTASADSLIDVLSKRSDEIGERARRIGERR